MIYINIMEYTDNFRFSKEENKMNTPKFLEKAFVRKI